MRRFFTLQLEPDSQKDDSVLDKKDVSHTSIWLFRGRSACLKFLHLYPFWGVILLGALLRFWGLGDRPLHFDESLHAYFSMILLHNNIDNWSTCLATASANCYRYDPLTHGPFQFHIIAITYRISQWLGSADQGINTTTVRIPAAISGTLLIGLPYFIHDYIGKVGAWLASFFLAVSPGMVYFSRFAREDIYMAFFTLLMVVAIARYIRDRRGWWLLISALAFTLSYATNEATFLTIAVFGSFLGALLMWEIGLHWHFPFREKAQTGKQQFLPQTMAPLTLLLYFLALAIFARLFFGEPQDLSAYITKSTANLNIANTFVTQLKVETEEILPWLGIGLVIVVCVLLIREHMGYVPQKRGGLARFIEPQKQPLLDTILTMPWMHWFFALICSAFVFTALFTVLFTYVPGGIGDGIWQGLFYWIQQQHVARGGQPWYYYLLLIPLYEQIGVVFGLVGIVRCLIHPTRLRLFLIYWFLGNALIYSWAAEKMPWLMIHIMLPLLLLAGIGLEPMITVLPRLFKKPLSASEIVSGRSIEERLKVWQPGKRSLFPKIGAIGTLLIATLLLVITLQNMIQVSYIHQADANHEMMVYVQTTPAINTMLSKVDLLDQQLNQGRHQLSIGITTDATWPLSWYLRDYTNVCFNFPTSCPDQASHVQVIFAESTDFTEVQTLYGTNFTATQYHLFDQWDQGYMPPLCQPTPHQQCQPQQYVGVGPLLWLSYGDSVPAHAQFDFLSAAQRVWQWWWLRIPIGRADGGGFTSITLFVRNR